jgi:hypothetical protein
MSRSWALVASVLGGLIFASGVFLLSGTQGFVAIALAIALGLVFGAFIYSAASRRPPT